MEERRDVGFVVAMGERALVTTASNAKLSPARMVTSWRKCFMMLPTSCLICEYKRSKVELV